MPSYDYEVTLRLSHDKVIKDPEKWIASCLNCNPNHVAVEGVKLKKLSTVCTPVQLRRDRETGKPVIFYYNQRKDGSDYWLECFDHEGTNEPDNAYRLRCEKLDSRNLPEDAVKLLRRWNNLPGDYGVPVQRLRRPK